MPQLTHFTFRPSELEGWLRCDNCSCAFREEHFQTMPFLDEEHREWCLKLLWDRWMSEEELHARR